MVILPPVPAVVAEAPVYHPIRIKIAVVNNEGQVIPVARNTVDIRRAGSEAYQRAQTNLNGELNIAIPPGRYELYSFYIYRPGPGRIMYSWDWVPFEVVGPGTFEFSNDTATF